MLGIAQFLPNCQLYTNRQTGPLEYLKLQGIHAAQKYLVSDVHLSLSRVGLDKTKREKFHWSEAAGRVTSMKKETVRHDIDVDNTIDEERTLVEVMLSRQDTGKMTLIGGKTAFGDADVTRR